MESEYTLNAYEKNQVMLYAVQGECESRTVIFSIIEKSGIVLSASNADVTNKMLDLTGCTAYLYAMQNGQIVASCRGNITNARNGTVQFVLPSEFTNVSGKLPCMIVLTKQGFDLRIVGITLDVQESGDTSAIFQLYVTRNRACSAIVTVEDNGAVYQLANGEKLIFTLKDGNTVILTKELTSSDYDSTFSGYILHLSSAETDISAGTYRYDIALYSDGETETVIPETDFIVR